MANDENRKIILSEEEEKLILVTHKEMMRTIKEKLNGKINRTALIVSHVATCATIAAIIKTYNIKDIELFYKTTIQFSNIILNGNSIAENI